jgi:hypothetical protein
VRKPSETDVTMIPEAAKAYYGLVGACKTQSFLNIALDDRVVRYFLRSALVVVWRFDDVKLPCSSRRTKKYRRIHFWIERMLVSWKSRVSSSPNHVFAFCFPRYRFVLQAGQSVLMLLSAAPWDSKEGTLLHIPV